VGVARRAATHQLAHRGALVPTGIAEMAMVLRPGTVVRRLRYVWDDPRPVGDRYGGVGLIWIRIPKRGTGAGEALT
jgi:hypothetical protein